MKRLNFLSKSVLTVLIIYCVIPLSQVIKQTESALLFLPLLHQTPRFYFEWLVPGMLRDKCIALIKTLPKQLRRHFVPVPDYADKILLNVAAQDRPLTEALRSNSID